MTVTSAGTVTQVREQHAAIDCDIHNAMPNDATFRKYLPDEWQAYHQSNGRRGHVGSGYPRAVPHAARVDSWPPSGLPPGGDLGFMREQLLDYWGFEYGILNCLGGAGGDLNLPYAAALCRAMNDWQVSEWLEPEPRLRASLLVPYEDADLAAAEIARMGDHPGFVQILLVCRTREPLGHWKYWKMYEAAVRHNLPVGIHFGGAGGGPITGAGWPTHYMEDHAGMSQAFQAQVASYALSGVFDAIPELKIVLIEGGFAWLPPLMWRLDHHWQHIGNGTVPLARLPSEYIRDHMWLTTQPMEEPAHKAHFVQLLDQLQMYDRLMFATDYPHWDFDSPTTAFPVELDSDLKRAIMADNAKKLYGLL